MSQDPPETGKRKETYSSLEPLEGGQQCQHLYFSLLKPILDF